MSHFTETFRSKSKKTALLANTIFFSRSLAVLIVVLLLVSVAYLQQQNAQLQNNNTVLENAAFRNQFAEGKACGMLTAKEASALLGQNVVVGGTVVTPGSPAVIKLSGNPRVDSCEYRVLKSSDGYIDIVLKKYESSATASTAYDKDVPNFFEQTNEDTAGLGQKLQYGSGLYDLLKDNLVVQVSASYSPRRDSVQTKELARQILFSIVNKL